MSDFKISFGNNPMHYLLSFFLELIFGPHIEINGTVLTKEPTIFFWNDVAFASVEPCHGFCGIPHFSRKTAI